MTGFLNQIEPPQEVQKRNRCMVVCTRYNLQLNKVFFFPPKDLCQGEIKTLLVSSGCAGRAHSRVELYQLTEILCLSEVEPLTT